MVGKGIGREELRFNLNCQGIPLWGGLRTRGENKKALSSQKTPKKGTCREKNRVSSSLDAAVEGKVMVLR